MNMKRRDFLKKSGLALGVAGATSFPHIWMKDYNFAWADSDEIEVWGDGQQTRSFMYIDDCVEGIYRVTHSDIHEPLNLGMDTMVTVDELVDLIAEISGKSISKRHDLTKPQGVRGRNSDNTLLNEVLGWEPSISLADGLSITYRWIEEQLRENGRLAGAA